MLYVDICLSVCLCNELQNIINHYQNVFCIVLVNIVLVLFIVPAWVLLSKFNMYYWGSAIFVQFNNMWQIALTYVFE